MTLVRRTKSYADRVEGTTRNPYARKIGSQFNALGREAILRGEKAIPVMMPDGTVKNFKVNVVKDGYAVLEDSDGEIFGVDLNSNHKE